MAGFIIIQLLEGGCLGAGGAAHTAGILQPAAVRCFQRARILITCADELRFHLSGDGHCSGQCHQTHIVSD